MFQTEVMQNLELYGYGESVASNMARVALAEKKDILQIQSYLFRVQRRSFSQRI